MSWEQKCSSTFKIKAVACYTVAVLIVYLHQMEASNLFRTGLTTLITLQQGEIVPASAFQSKEPGGF